MSKPDLTDLNAAGTQFWVRVTPKASRNVITRDASGIRVYVTTVPEGGKANQAVTKILAKAIGTAKSRLTLIKGETARDKCFRVD